MKVVIMAGGKGTRITSVASDIPKPMINIQGKPGGSAADSEHIAGELMKRFKSPIQ